MSTKAQRGAGGDSATEQPGSTQETVTMSFDGRPLKAAPGQSIASALMVQNIVAWRSTRKGARPRGLFCGIGICFDCLVTVDGAANQRACLVEVREGLHIEGSWTPEDGSRA